MPPKNERRPRDPRPGGRVGIKRNRRTTAQLRERSPNHTATPGRIDKPRQRGSHSPLRRSLDNTPDNPAAFSLAFYGLLRVNEVLSLLISQFLKTSCQVSVFLHRCKTNQTGKPLVYQIIKLPDTNFCPTLPIKYCKLPPALEAGGGNNQVLELKPSSHTITDSPVRPQTLEQCPPQKQVA
ncbi:uncharacterized protein LOC130050542 [Ostrea edulis]|uniref:uncharacterized protein LOC130050542 n=1 Tax=Ostrea edulis TaxID=37623 RepID=UPI0024AF562C|nr:uncharacterized protein LOC130050542 [Ostrea edulis]